VRITDEQIIASLLSCGSNRDAAASLGITEKALYERMKKPEFQSKLTDAKTAILENATNAAESRLSAAVNTIYEIMVNPENGAQVRLNSADALIRNAVKMIQLVDVSKRMDEIEAAIREAENEH
jgi:DNA-binding Lrp family transcriptional regulator